MFFWHPKMQGLESDVSAAVSGYGWVILQSGLFGIPGYHHVLDGEDWYTSQWEVQIGDFSALWMEDELTNLEMLWTVDIIG